MGIQAVRSKTFQQFQTGSDLKQRPFYPKIARMETRPGLTSYWAVNLTSDMTLNMVSFRLCLKSFLILFLTSFYFLYFTSFLSVLDVISAHQR